MGVLRWQRHESAKNWKSREACKVTNLDFVSKKKERVGCHVFFSVSSLVSCPWCSTLFCCLSIHSLIHSLPQWRQRKNVFLLRHRCLEEKERETRKEWRLKVGRMIQRSQELEAKHHHHQPLLLCNHHDSDDDDDPLSFLIINDIRKRRSILIRTRISVSLHNKRELEQENEPGVTSLEKRASRKEDSQEETRGRIIFFLLPMTLINYLWWNNWWKHSGREQSISKEGNLLEKGNDSCLHQGRILETKVRVMFREQETQSCSHSKDRSEQSIWVNITL